MSQKVHKRFKYVCVLTRFFVLSEHIFTLMCTSVYMTTYMSTALTSLLASGTIMRIRAFLSTIAPSISI